MNIFKKLFSFNKRSFDPQLLGTWELVKSTNETNQRTKEIMEFKQNGNLIYTIEENGETGVMLLTYKTQNGVIISDQPSHPREERTNYSFQGNEMLILESKDYKSWLKKIY